MKFIVDKNNQISIRNKKNYYYYYYYFFAMNHRFRGKKFSLGYRTYDR